MADQINYCGYKIDKHGIHKTQDNIETILNVPRLILPQVKTFIDLITYYAKF